MSNTGIPFPFNFHIAQYPEGRRSTHANEFIVFNVDIHVRTCLKSRTGNGIASLFDNGIGNSIHETSSSVGILGLSWTTNNYRGSRVLVWRRVKSCRVIIARSASLLKAIAYACRDYNSLTPHDLSSRLNRNWINWELIKIIENNKKNKFSKRRNTEQAKSARLIELTE